MILLKNFQKAFLFEFVPVTYLNTCCCFSIPWQCNGAVHWAVQSTLNFDLIDRANPGSCIFFCKGGGEACVLGDTVCSVTFFYCSSKQALSQSSQNGNFCPTRNSKVVFEIEAATCLPVMQKPCILSS